MNDKFVNNIRKLVYKYIQIDFLFFSCSFSLKDLEAKAFRCHKHVKYAYTIHTLYYSGIPIKFANEIIYTVSAQFTHQTVHIMEI